MSLDTVVPRWQIRAIAQAAHEVNRAYCIGLRDNTQWPWEQAPDWQRESAEKGVRAALAGATPEQLHESWMQEKIDTGWTYGPEKNVETKTHPCLVPYADLPPSQRAKDVLFRATVDALVRALGYT